ncbi:MAG: glycerol-3-phosphate dehydrogenase/oxidase [Ramlibacter sp.]|nr:glycerol-3-phosphate dehydrogenase/oxidase [Ramlibacter sp.]
MTRHMADEQRLETLQALASGQEFDAVIIGGGATGLGAALDAALRGYKVALVERADFGQGTSSRSSKLVHGGVRYLAQGDFKLVYEALRERANLLANAPHIAQPLSFVMPAYKLWQMPFYGAGLKAYDALAGSAGIGGTRFMGPAGVREMLPTVRTQGLLGGVSYWDGQFDDARLALAIARTAQAHGATLANYCLARSLVGDGRKLSGVEVVDRETGKAFVVRSRCIINATGVWADDLLRDAAAGNRRPLVAPSQGIHLSFDRSFLPTTSAVFWPRTSDGRVLFAIPWLGKTIVGTTDSKRADVHEEPEPLPGEIDYLLKECANFFAAPPRRADILSAWVGLRPLVNPQAAGADQDTKSISREHTVLVRPDGLVTVTGGKWTTYRSMAQDVLDRCRDAGLMDARGPCVTAKTRLVGANGSAGTTLTAAAGLHSYGSEADLVCSLPGADRYLAPGLTEAMTRFAVRHEYARTVEDVLARRSRLLFLDARAAQEGADAVADVVESETAVPSGRAAFKAMAARYLNPCH